MKVLITIDWYYPAYRAGGPVTSVFNLVNALKDEFDFWVLTSNKDYGNVDLAVPVNTWVNIAERHHVFYASSLSAYLGQLKSVDFDVLVVNGIYSWKFSVLPVLLWRSYGKIIFPRGMLSQHSLSLKSHRKKIFLFLAKMLTFYKNTCFVASSAAEQEEIKRIFPGKNVFMLENFVTLPEFHYPIEKKKGILRLFSLGRLSPVKNYEFAMEVMSRIIRGKIIWDIYGGVENEDYFRKLKNKAAYMPASVDINFKGNVSPDELPKTISQYHFLFLPTRGENFGHAIYETLAAARPVIISNRTPWSQIPQKKAIWDYPLEIEPFVDAIYKAMDMSQENFNELCYAAFSSAKEIFSRVNDRDKAKKILSLCKLKNR